MSQPGNTYEDRKLAGLCTYSTGCGQPSLDDSSLCKRHQRREAARTTAASQLLRAERRAKGLCAFCGNKSTQYRCPTCRVRSLVVKQPSATASATAFEAKLDRIRARTVLEDDGRTRYKGQLRRGRQSVADLDEADLDTAIRELTRARDGLRLARSEANMQLPRIQRREAEHVALGYAYLAIRLVDEDVLTRNGYKRPDRVVDEEDEDEGDDA